MNFHTADLQRANLHPPAEPARTHHPLQLDIATPQPQRRLHSSLDRARSPQLQAKTLLDNRATAGHHLNVSTEMGQPRYRLATAATKIDSDHWNASFLNRTAANLTDYSSYDFSRANAVKDLGWQRSGGGIVARLMARYRRSSPDEAIQKDRFAMQAWTQVRLEAGKFYRLVSKSDDGTRFFFKDAQTGKVLTTLNGDWRDRRSGDSRWEQMLNVAQSGQYDFYMQYYENRGQSTINVRLEEIAPTGRVVPTSGVNLRSRPSTLSNTPIDLLSAGETLSIKRAVRSPDDTSNANWYEVTTAEGQHGYVSADPRWVELVNGGSAVVIDRGSLPSPIDTGGLSGSAGVIGRKVLLTADDQISLRTDKDIAGAQITKLGLNTPVTILEKVTGGYYLNRFDQWYKVRLNLNGQAKEGYVAAYYIDALSSDGRYQTAISASNPYYRPHLNEVTAPVYHPTSYKPFIESVTAKYAWLKPSIVAGIGSRESAWGLVLSPRGPAGTGDGGHGRGLMQIDDRYHQTFINSGLWSNPQENIRYAIDQVLSRNYDSLARNTNLQGIDLLRGAIAAYNSGLTNVMKALGQGLDVDHYTTGQDYSWDVLNRAGWFQLHGWT